ncbi:MAG: ethylbenzene dehydrogenase-related protein [Candidatus Latescibacterota bacterium]
MPVLLSGLVLLAACQQAPQTTPDVVLVESGKIAADPADPAWQQAPRHVAPLLPQDLVEPRQLQTTTAQVTVQGMTDGEAAAFRLSWSDDAVDDVPGPARFADACAVQLPRQPGPDLPAPQMGEGGRPVEIVLWRATWQAVVDGRAREEIADLYPRAAIDHYPFRAPALQEGSPEQQEMARRYAPARALGNPMAGPRQRPVETLVALGPGTLTPDPSLAADGRGVYDVGQQAWSVVLVRPLGEELRSTGRTQAAFAVWQGSRGETGARKMRTGWVPVATERKR